MLSGIMADIRNVAILGSTGSIGCSTLDVVRAIGDKLSIAVLSAHRRLAELCAQAVEHRPRWVVATDRHAGSQFDWSRLPSGTSVRTGYDELCELVGSADIDIVVAAIVGSAGLTGTWAAVAAGKTVALANKEALVVAGPLVMDLAKRRGATILPVDSEHCAVFQCLQAGRREDAARVILTASGGPFRDWTTEQLRDVTVEQALAHPTWSMGPKITVDSATMMNKAFEIVEARWLFDLDPAQIEVVVHPQSIVHSLVEFVDGSVIAQLGPPDMRLPIQFALTYPDRRPGPAAKLDLTEALQLEFVPADRERFPALALGHEVARAGGTTGAVLNAANEAAVAMFLDRRLRFTEIVPACRAILDNHDFDPNPTLDGLLRLDAWARQEVSRWACT
ncbi:MAG: 1-deoxy-D-xylulose-5-phosphate reductoisomerase [Planctomycetes bacterium]|nr:1-deoxy-D-xylulose-5-phosphate reductoisomerase [Planctomycetota bacterium]